MHVLRFLHATRVFFCLGLLSLAALATGCSESNPVESMGKDEAQAKGKAQMEARKKAFGNGGYTTKPSAPAK
jgi:hypothetical protein